MFKLLGGRILAFPISETAFTSMAALLRFPSLPCQRGARADAFLFRTFSRKAFDDARSAVSARPVVPMGGGTLPPTVSGIPPKAKIEAVEYGSCCRGRCKEVL